MQKAFLDSDAPQRKLTLDESRREEQPVSFCESPFGSRLAAFRAEGLGLSETLRCPKHYVEGKAAPNVSHIETLTSILSHFEVARYINGITSRRIIDFLKDSRYESSLMKLRRANGERQYKYSLWDHHPNVKLVSTENGLIEKANYIHLNPVRAGLVESAEDYLWSSIRYWQRRPLETEPLSMDLDLIAWHK